MLDDGFVSPSSEPDRILTLISSAHVMLHFPDPRLFYCISCGVLKIKQKDAELFGKCRCAFLDVFSNVLRLVSCTWFIMRYSSVEFVCLLSVVGVTWSMSVLCPLCGIQCGDPFQSADIVVLNGTKEEMEKLRENMEERRAKAKTKVTCASHPETKHNWLTHMTLCSPTQDTVSLFNVLLPFGRRFFCS